MHYWKGKNKPYLASIKRWYITITHKRFMDKIKKYSFLSTFVIMVLLLTGCEKQSYVSVSDTRGIEEGAPVIWYEDDAFVGTVSEVKEIDGQYLIYIEFQENYEESIRSDVKACPLLEPKISDKPILLLVGGKDDTMPLLESGSQIPEISLTEFQRVKLLNFGEWFNAAKMRITLVLIAFMLIFSFICILKIVAKIIKLGLSLAVIAILAIYIFNLSRDWEQYKKQASSYVKEIKNEEIQEWLQKRYFRLKENIPEVMENNEP